MDKGKAAREIALAYGAVADQLGAAMGQLTVANHSPMRAVELRAAAGRLIERLNQAAKRWTAARIPEAYGESRTVTVARLEIIGAKRPHAAKDEPIWGSWKGRISGQKLAGKALDDLLRANLSIKKTVDQYIMIIGRAAGKVREGPKKLQAFIFDPKTEASLNDLINDALDEGMDEGTLSRQIADLLQSKAAGGNFIEIGGRTYSLRDYSELVARTRLREAMSLGTMDAAQEYHHDLVEIPEKANSCDECKDIEGKIYSLSGEDPDYEPLTDEITPPIHPNCEHYLRVVPYAEGDRGRG